MGESVEDAQFFIQTWQHSHLSLARKKVNQPIQVEVPMELARFSLLTFYVDWHEFLKVIFTCLGVLVMV